MRNRVPIFVCVAILLAAPRSVAAQDAGADGTNGDSGTDSGSGEGIGIDGGSADSGGMGEDAGDGGTDEDAAAGGTVSAAPIIACDGNLCDTLQGRPEFACSVDAGSLGAGGLDGAWAGISIALGTCLLRRSKRGARSPITGGDA